VMLSGTGISRGMYTGELSSTGMFGGNCLGGNVWEGNINPCAGIQIPACSGYDLHQSGKHTRRQNCF